MSKFFINNISPDEMSKEERRLIDKYKDDIILSALVVYKTNKIEDEEMKKTILFAMCHAFTIGYTIAYKEK